jgi:hypothetical protein
MVDETYGNMKAKVFFVWGATCTACVVLSYFLVPETKGLSLEQVDRMLEETTPRTSKKWTPHHMHTDRSGGSSLEATEKIAGSESTARREHRDVCGDGQNLPCCR